MARKPKTPNAQNTAADDAVNQMNGDGDVAMEDQPHHRNEHAGAHNDDSSDTLDNDSDAGLELLGQGMKAFATVIQNLRDLGVEELVLPLPKVVVLGDQSTGKSSLIEGISGIKVPRSTGTCTRCPFEVNLTTSEAGSSWNATIYLHKKYIYEGTQSLLPVGKHTVARSERATKNRPFGPWIAQTFPENILFFRTNKKADIPEALRLAQLATLNPGADPARYIPKGRNESGSYRQCQFSPNVIRLDMSSPDVPNLSFYDLPGVINQAETPEEEYLVALVQNLVRSYIEDDACINLLAMPMTDDAANSTASKLVQEAKANGRTIGVLTKSQPDRVQDDDMSQWIEVLQAKKFKIGHGYYVVRNDPDPELSNALAREREDQFFLQEHWTRTLGKHRDRFGTLKLTSKLSKLLNTQIKTSLPKITEQVRSKVTDIIARLDQLPEPPKGNLSLKIFEKILHLEQDLRCHLDGGSEEYPFRKEFHAAALRFRETIKFSYPRLSLVDMFTTRIPYRPSATPTPSGIGRDAIPIDLDEEDNVNEAPRSTQVLTPTKRKHATTNMSQSSPSKRSRLNDIPQHTANRDNPNSSYDGSEIDRTAPFARRFTLTEIRTTLRDAHIGLPGQIDPKATERMIKQSLSRWDEPLDVLLEFTRQTCLDMIIQRASLVFAQGQGTRCFETVLEICQSFFHEQFTIQKASAKRILYIERQAALTLNEDAMKSASETALATLESRCREERVKAFLTKQDVEWDSTPSEKAKKEMSKVTDAQIGSNPYSIELRAMADVRGYYDCAYTQFVDAVYKGIRAELFITCRNELGNALKQRIGLEEKDAEQRCAILLAVDPENERIRGELMKQKANLEKAYSSLCDHIRDSRLRAWPPRLPFHTAIRDSNPPAYLDFISVRATGTAQEGADFTRLMDEEVDYLRRHPLREGPSHLLVTRKFTKVVLRCAVASRQVYPAWSFELSLQMLSTMGNLVRLNGLKEFKFEVTGLGAVVLQICHIWLKDPWNGNLQLEED
ncbi:MAG: hypothetical protein Q9169_005299 [Polycauliona sp. 2 TL-2023]